MLGKKLEATYFELNEYLIEGPLIGSLNIQNIY